MHSPFDAKLTKRLDGIATRFFKKFKRDGEIGDISEVFAQEARLPADFPDNLDQDEALIYMMVVVDQLEEESRDAENENPPQKSATLKQAIEIVSKMNPRERQQLADELGLKGSD